MVHVIYLLQRRVRVSVVLALVRAMPAFWLKNRLCLCWSWPNFFRASVVARLYHVVFVLVLVLIPCTGVRGFLMCVLRGWSLGGSVTWIWHGLIDFFFSFSFFRCFAVLIANLVSALPTVWLLMNWWTNWRGEMALFSSTYSTKKVKQRSLFYVDFNSAVVTIKWLANWQIMWRYFG